MNRLRENFRTDPDTGRATELDPATFAPRANWWPLAGIGGVLVLGLAFWAVIAAIVF